MTDQPPATYTPEADGLPDPGEVVWTWVPYEDDPAQGKDRPVLVLARGEDGLLRCLQPWWPLPRRTPSSIDEAFPAPRAGKSPSSAR